MKRIPALPIAFAIFALAGTAASQSRLAVKPDSKLTLSGSSNLHDWSCSTNDIKATIDVDSGFAISPFVTLARPISRVTVTIPVKSLKCGHDKMDNNMYAALDAEKYPEIQYTLTAYDIQKDATADEFVANTVGQLIVSGKAVKVDMPVKTTRIANGVSGEGSVSLLMTDFGIKPPRALLGTLRTRNEITVNFHLQLDRAVAVALMQQ